MDERFVIVSVIVVYIKSLYCIGLYLEDEYFLVISSI